jgi:hypothetical protein
MSCAFFQRPTSGEDTEMKESVESLNQTPRLHVSVVTLNQCNLDLKE